MRYIIKIEGVPTEREYNKLSFGDRLAYRSQISGFQDKAKRIDFLAKHKSIAAAFKEFRKLYKPTQWYAVDRDGPNWHDDSFEIWFLD